MNGSRLVSLRYIAQEFFGPRNSDCNIDELPLTLGDILVSVLGNNLILSL